MKLMTLVLNCWNHVTGSLFIKDIMTSDPRPDVMKRTMTTKALVILKLIKMTEEDDIVETSPLDISHGIEIVVESQ